MHVVASQVCLSLPQSVHYCSPACRAAHRLGGFCYKPRSCQLIIQVWIAQLQVFFWFSGHGAAGAGGSQLLIGEDGRAVNFLDEFDTHVTRAIQRDQGRQRRGASVVAVLDCCRDAMPSAATESEVADREAAHAQCAKTTSCRPTKRPFAALHADAVAPGSCSGQAEGPPSANEQEPVSYAMPVRTASRKAGLYSQGQQ